MKVILLRDVARLGKRYSVVEVPDGFALNKLLPQKLAQAATPENLKRVQTYAKEVAAHQAADEAGLQAVLSQLKGVVVPVVVEANAQGHLFKAVKVDEVVAALQRQGVTLESQQLSIETPIKSLGEHTIQVKQGKVGGSITIMVTQA